MKMRAIFWFTLGAVLIWAGCTTEENSGTGPGPYLGNPISGLLTDRLSAADSPYLVTGDITVPDGETLVIEPGVEVRFNSLYKFVVQGHLEAVGTPDNNIVFTSVDGVLGAGDFGQWRSIVFDTGDDVSEMAFCVVAFGAVWDSTERYPVYPDTVDTVGMWLNSAIMIWNCSPIIRNCNVMYNGYHGIYCIGASNPYILNNNIYENDGDGIRCELGATAVIRYNNSKENNARQFAETPPFVGVLDTVNVNRDSCDVYRNIKLDPKFVVFADGSLPSGLQSCSPLIGAGLDTLGAGTTIGSIPYYVGATELRGLLPDTTLIGGTYQVTCNVFVDPDKGFTLNDATLLFQGIYQLQVDGLLQAEGTTFISDGVDKWYGILFSESSDPASYIRDCHFINASSALTEEPFGGAITIQGVSPEISGNIFEGNEYSGISCQYGAEPEISYNDIIGFGIAGIYCYNNCHPSIHHNDIRDGLGYGIWANFFSSPTIRTNLIHSTAFIGIKCQDQSSPTIEYNTIIENGYSGVEIRKQSNPTLKYNIIAFNGLPGTWVGSTYGNGITVKSSSFPSIQYNDVYQPPDSGNTYSGITPDATNLSLDPLFVDQANRNYHLLSESPCMAVAVENDTIQIGAYGLGNW